MLFTCLHLHNHLGYFQLAIITSKAATSAHTQIFTWVSIFVLLDKSLGVELLGSRAYVFNLKIVSQCSNCLNHLHSHNHDNNNCPSNFPKLVVFKVCLGFSSFIELFLFNFNHSKNTPFYLLGYSLDLGNTTCVILQIRAEYNINCICNWRIRTGV